MTQYPGPNYPNTNYPTPNYQSHYTRTAPLRPTSVTVLAIIGIVFGGLGLLCKPLSFAALFMPQPVPNPAVQMQKDMMAFNVGNAAIGTLVSALLLASSIGCLSLKPWARKGMLTYAGLAIVLTIAGGIITMVWMLPKIQEMQRQMMTQSSGRGAPAPPPQMMSMIQSASTVGAVIAIVISLIFPACLIYFFTRPNVKSAFGDPTAGGPYGAPQPGGYYAGPPQPPGQYPPG